MGCLQMWQRARMRSWTLLEREFAISRFQQRLRTARPDGLFHKSTGFTSRIAHAPANEKTRRIRRAFLDTYSNLAL